MTSQGFEAELPQHFIRVFTQGGCSACPNLRGVSGASIHATASFGARDYSRSNPPSLGPSGNAHRVNSAKRALWSVKPKPGDAVEHGTPTPRPPPRQGVISGPPPTDGLSVRPRSADLAVRRMELKTAVGTLLVVVIDVLLEYPLGVAPATNDHPVETLATGAPHPTLGMALAFGACRGVRINLTPLRAA